MNIKMNIFTSLYADRT